MNRKKIRLILNTKIRTKELETIIIITIILRLRNRLPNRKKISEVNRNGNRNRGFFKAITHL